jgi:hypothetical protein
MEASRFNILDAGMQQCRRQEQANTGFGSPLSTEMYAEFYALRSRASTMTAAAIKWLTTEMPTRLPGLSQKTDGANSGASGELTPFRVLSVGSGGGELDLKILQMLRARLSPGHPLHRVRTGPGPFFRPRRNHCRSPASAICCSGRICVPGTL